MSDGKRFSEADHNKLVELLNFVAQNAEFKSLDVKKVLAFTRLLNWAQSELLPKIQANQFEITEVRKVKK